MLDRDSRFAVGIETGERGVESIVQDGEGPRWRPWVVGYGVSRGNALGERDREVVKGAFGDVHTLFDEPPSLHRATSWLYQLRNSVSKEIEQQIKREGSIDRSKPGPAKQRWDTVCNALRIVLGVDEIERDEHQENTIWVESKKLGRVRFDALSDGYLSFAGWTVDLIDRFSVEGPALTEAQRERLAQTLLLRAPRLGPLRDASPVALAEEDRRCAYAQASYLVSPTRSLTFVQQTLERAYAREPNAVRSLVGGARDRIFALRGAWVAAGDAQRHAPMTHACPAAHDEPHAPQLRASLARFTHAPPHAVVPAGQPPLVVHIPAVQRWPEAQSLSTLHDPLATHAPARHVCPDAQMGDIGSLSSIAPSQSSSRPLQRSGDGLHIDERHAPMTHACPAAHDEPHAPQLRASLARFTHAPPHAVVPAGQPPLVVHIPAVQRWPEAQSLSARHMGLASAPASTPASALLDVHTPATHDRPAAHDEPHAPQLRGSLARLTHAPLHAVRPIPQPLLAVHAPAVQRCPAAQSESARHARRRTGTNSEKWLTRTIIALRAASKVAPSIEVHRDPPRGRVSTSVAAEFVGIVRVTGVENVCPSGPITSTAPVASTLSASIVGAAPSFIVIVTVCASAPGGTVMLAPRSAPCETWSAPPAAPIEARFAAGSIAHDASAKKTAVLISVCVFMNDSRTK